MTSHPADSGKNEFMGADITHMKPHGICGNGIAGTYQQKNLFLNLSVFDNVIAGMLNDSMEEQRRRERVWHNGDERVWGCTEWGFGTLIIISLLFWQGNSINQECGLSALGPRARCTLETIRNIIDHLQRRWLPFGGEVVHPDLVGLSRACGHNSYSIPALIEWT